MGEDPQKRLDHQQGETRKRRHTWKLNIWAGGLQEILASRVTAQTLSAANQLRKELCRNQVSHRRGVHALQVGQSPGASQEEAGGRLNLRPTATGDRP